MYDRPERVFHVYIMASKPRGVLYVGMTSGLAGRAWKHRERVLECFTKRYWVDRLVYFERHDDARVAARRERAMKRWRRDWRIELIERHNPTWRDLFADGGAGRRLQVVRPWSQGTGKIPDSLRKCVGFRECKRRGG
jgi:putative endonuclease